LLPDDVAERVVAERLDALPPGRGFVLDGYPRSGAQASTLPRLLAGADRGDPRPVAVRLDVPRDELVRRLTRRRDLERRPDDSDESIARRLDLYDDRAPELLDALAGSSEMMPVDGSRPVELVADDIVEALRGRS
jgi:adenylate kinase